MSNWRLIAPPEDAKSAREISEDTVLELERVAKQLGLRIAKDDNQRKLYLGLPGNAPAGITLNVPYYYQYDSATSQGDRMCFSSTCAMLVKFLRPNALTNSPNADDEYLRRVLQYGDTTNADAQIQALAHFGIKAKFSKKLSWADLDAQLKRGAPMPIGILHHGPASKPSGGGHWLLVIGKQGDYYRVHDPAGELDLVAGQYIGGSGKGLLYSALNLGKRWMVEGAGSGWGIVVG